MERLRILKYRLGLFVFKWVRDSDGDIGFQVLGVVTFIKYKESTLVYWFKKFVPAGKWQGYDASGRVILTDYPDSDRY